MNGIDIISSTAASKRRGGAACDHYDGPCLFDIEETFKMPKRRSLVSSVAAHGFDDCDGTAPTPFSHVYSPPRLCRERQPIVWASSSRVHADATLASNCSLGIRAIATTPTQMTTGTGMRIRSATYPALSLPLGGSWEHVLQAKAGVSWKMQQHVCLGRCSSYGVGPCSARILAHCC